MTDIGPGDCVEYVGGPDADAGTRAWVLSVEPFSSFPVPCAYCDYVGDWLWTTIGGRLRPDIPWCPCAWRKVGGDYEEAKRCESVDA